MPLTVIVRSSAGEDARLTFDGTQRVVIGRGSGSDVRLPDPSVSHRHATLRANGAEFLLIDEGSTNGTFVGDVRIAPSTSRIVRSGDIVRVGRVWLELRVDQSPITRDVAAATRDLALSLVSRAMAEIGADPTTQVRVVEGRDQGATLSLAEEGRAYVIGRAPHCDLPVADVDVSREHLRVTRQGDAVVLRDLSAKNGTWIGDARAPREGDVVWRASQMARIGRTVLALVDPLSETLAKIEGARDEVLAPDAPAPDPPAGLATHLPHDGAPEPAPTEAPAHLEANPEIAARAAAAAQAPARARRSAWSVVDALVIATALGILALSLFGLVWLLRS